MQVIDIQAVTERVCRLQKQIQAASNDIQKFLASPQDFVASEYFESVNTVMACSTNEIRELLELLNISESQNSSIEKHDEEDEVVLAGAEAAKNQEISALYLTRHFTFEYGGDEILLLDDLRRPIEESLGEHLAITVSQGNLQTAVLVPESQLKAGPLTPSDDGLYPFRVLMQEEPRSRFLIAFDCDAEDHAHAQEQAKNAYPSCVIELTIKRALPSDHINL